MMGKVLQRLLQSAQTPYLFVVSQAIPLLETGTRCKKSDWFTESFSSDSSWQSLPEEVHGSLDDHLRNCPFNVQ